MVLTAPEQLLLHLASKLEFDHVTMSNKNRGHWYSLDSMPAKTKYPSVTTLLNALAKPTLTIWRDKQIRDALPGCGNDFKEAVHSVEQYVAHTAAIGNVTHAMIAYMSGACLIRGDGSMEERHPQPEITPDVESDVEACADMAAFCVGFMESEKLRPVAAEYPFCVRPRDPFERRLHRRPGYGGTIDMICLDENDNLVILDWKTSKDIYDTHLMQAAAYAYAAIPFTLRPGLPVRAMVVAPKIEKYREPDLTVDFERFCGVAAAWQATRKTVIYELYPEEQNYVSPAPKKEDYSCARCGHDFDSHGEKEVDHENDEVYYEDHPCTGDDGECGCDQFVERETDH